MSGQQCIERLNLPLTLQLVTNRGMIRTNLGAHETQFVCRRCAIAQRGAKYRYWLANYAIEAHLLVSDRVQCFHHVSNIGIAHRRGESGQGRAGFDIGALTRCLERLGIFDPREFVIDVQCVSVSADEKRNCMYFEISNCIYAKSKAFVQFLRTS